MNLKGGVGFGIFGLGIEGTISRATSPQHILDAFYGKGNTNYVGDFSPSVTNAFSKYNSAKMDALIKQLIEKLIEKHGKLGKLPNAVNVGSILLKLKKMSAKKKVMENAAVEEKALSEKAAAEEEAKVPLTIEELEAAAEADAVATQQREEEEAAVRELQNQKETKEFTFIVAIYNLLNKDLPDQAEYNQHKSPEQSNYFINKIQADLIKSQKLKIAELLLFNNPLDLDTRLSEYFKIYCKLTNLNINSTNLDAKYEEIIRTDTAAKAATASSKLQHEIDNNKMETNDLLWEMKSYEKLQCPVANANSGWGLPAVTSWFGESKNGTHPDVRLEMFTQVGDETLDAVLAKSVQELASIKKARDALVALYNNTCGQNVEMKNVPKGGSRRRRHQKRSKKTKKRSKSLRR